MSSGCWRMSQLLHTLVLFHEGDAPQRRCAIRAPYRMWGHRSERRPLAAALRNVRTRLHCRHQGSPAQAVRPHAQQRSSATDAADRDNHRLFLAKDMLSQLSFELSAGSERHLNASVRLCTEARGRRAGGGPSATPYYPQQLAVVRSTRRGRGVRPPRL
jgi:hypothetical protein